MTDITNTVNPLHKIILHVFRSFASAAIMIKI